MDFDFKTRHSIQQSRHNLASAGLGRFGIEVVGGFRKVFGLDQYVGEQRTMPFHRRVNVPATVRT